MRKRISLIWNHKKIAEKSLRKSCDVGLRCEKPACFLRSSDAKCLRFGLSLRFGLRCERPRCQIASDAGRAMRTTKLETVKITVVLGRLGAPVSLTLHLSWRWRMKIEIGLGHKKTEQKLNQKWRGLKNRIYEDRLSQLPKIGQSTDVNRRYFWVDGRFSAVNRR